MDKLLALMEEYAVMHHVPIIGESAANLLVNTVHNRKPRYVLELGTAIGYSALKMAGELPDNGTICTIEIDQNKAEIANSFLNQSQFGNQVQVVVGDASVVLPTIGGPFDLVFIDAAKGKYLEYLLLIIDKLQPGSVIVADNVLFRGWVQGSEPPKRFRTIVRRLREYLAFVTTDNRFTTELHDVGDGVAISYYKGETIV